MTLHLSLVVHSLNLLFKHLSVAFWMLGEALVLYTMHLDVVSTPHGLAIHRGTQSAQATSG